MRRPFGLWAFGVWWLANAVFHIPGLYMVATHSYPADMPPMLVSAALSITPIDLVGNTLIVVFQAGSGALLILLRPTALLAQGALLVSKAALELWDTLRNGFIEPSGPTL